MNIFKFFLFFFTFVCSVFADGFYTITKVYDGDTCWAVQDGVRTKVRLAGIDAPELKQQYGGHSRDYLASMILNKTVRLDIHGTDRYGRAIATIWIDEINVNAQMVLSGNAWAYPEYSTGLESYESYARLQKKGLWSLPNPIKPSNYRKKSK